jgi:acetyl-CoA carboxylase beta subunit
LTDNKRKLYCFGLQKYCLIIDCIVSIVYGGPNYDEKITGNKVYKEGSLKKCLTCNQGVYTNKYQIGATVCPCQKDITLYEESAAIIPILDDKNEK